MGDRPALTAEGESTGARRTVMCDQAVFTSVRSLIGEGYQLVGSSAGVLPQEKADLMRCSPSHGALFALEDGHAVGLLSYTLASGRRCIAYCGYAGREQSGRGGDRVYSHMVVLDRTNFALFDSDVTGVHSGLAEVVRRDGPILKAETVLQPLQVDVPGLPVTEEGTCTLSSFPSTTGNWLWPVAGMILAGRRVILVGLEDPFMFLKWLLWILPRSAREGLDVSLNVSFSPTRRLKLIFLPSVTLHVERLAASQSIDLWRAGQAVPPIEPAFASWLGLLKELWSQGRVVEMIGLTAQVPGKVCDESLSHLADKFRRQEQEKQQAESTD